MKGVHIPLLLFAEILVYFIRLVVGGYRLVNLRLVGERYLRHVGKLFNLPYEIIHREIVERRLRLDERGIVRDQLLLLRRELVVLGLRLVYLRVGICGYNPDFVNQRDDLVCKRLVERVDRVAQLGFERAVERSLFGSRQRRVSGLRRLYRVRKAYVCRGRNCVNRIDRGLHARRLRIARIGKRKRANHRLLVELSRAYEVRARG